MVRLLVGDAREQMATLAAESVHCVVTSPPYWSLRNYGTTPQVWGGSPDCPHVWEGEERHEEREATISGKTRTSERFYGDESRRFDGNHQKHTSFVTCPTCGAWRGELGAEPTPDLFVEHLVGIFRTVKRVLRADGTLWLNMGDCYATDTAGWRKTSWSSADSGVKKRSGAPGNLKPKDLVGVPWMLAFALRADGWYLRSDIIWAKGNPMPASVTDRPTTAHEYLFLLTKAPRYYYDATAIREKGVCPKGTRGAKGSVTRAGAGVNARPPEYKVYNGTRNKRSVWTINTQASGIPHYATFPAALVRPCVLAGCPPGGTVLDPFSGVGTVGVVAEMLGRDAVMIDLNPDSPAHYQERRRRLMGAKATPKKIAADQMELPLIASCSPSACDRDGKGKPDCSDHSPPPVSGSPGTA